MWRQANKNLERFLHSIVVAKGHIARPDIAAATRGDLPNQSIGVGAVNFKHHTRNLFAVIAGHGDFHITLGGIVDDGEFRCGTMLRDRTIVPAIRGKPIRGVV